MSLEIKLFHRIGGRTEDHTVDQGFDSAVVRQFLVEHQLTDLIEFKNVTYESVQQELHELLGRIEAPVLVANGRPVVGRELILDWLKTNLLRLRD